MDIIKEVPWSPPVVVQSNPEEKNRKSVKILIVAASAVAATAIITAGFIFAFYFMHETSKQALKTNNIRFNNNGEEVDETIDKYSDDVYKYTVRKSDRTYTIVEDYSRRVVAIRREGDGSDYCLVLPLTKENDEQKLDSYEQEEITLKNNTEKIDFRIDQQLIVNHDLLGPEAREMCQGYPLHWGIIGNNSTNTGSRQKRDIIHCTGCDCYRCGCGRIRCYCDECHRHASASIAQQ